MTDICRRLIINGRVQGVGYRAWFAKQAQAAGLQGWVRNRRNGTVEAVICGEEFLIEKTIAAAHDGPPLAEVRNINVQEDIYDGDTAFEIRDDA